jgi:hypothetical protein
MKIRAIYEGGVFKPKEAVSLPEGSEVKFGQWPDRRDTAILDKCICQRSPLDFRLENLGVEIAPSINCPLVVPLIRPLPKFDPQLVEAPPREETALEREIRWLTS